MWKLGIDFCVPVFRSGSESPDYHPAVVKVVNKRHSQQARITAMNKKTESGAVTIHLWRQLAP